MNQVYQATATLLLRDLQQLPFDPDAWGNFADRLGSYMNGSVVLGTVLLDGARPITIDHTNIADAAMRDYQKHFYKVSPWRDWMLRAEAGTVAAGGAVNELCPESYIHSEFYDDFLKPNDLHHGISARIMRDRTHVTDLAVLRPRGAGGIDAEEHALMARLAPRLRTALRVRRLLGSAYTASQGWEMPALGVVLTNRDGTILRANQAALDRFSNHDGVYVSRGAIRPTCDVAHGRLRQLVRQAVDGAGALLLRSGGDMLLPRPSRSPLRVTIVATPPTGDVYGQLEPAAILYLREPVSAAAALPVAHPAARLAKEPAGAGEPVNTSPG